jgi:signal transduction histidine kinase
MQAVMPSTPAFPRVASAVLAFSQRRWRILVVAMLALLHVAALRGVADPGARALLLAHLGLLLMWQPFLRGQHEVSNTQAAMIGLASAAVMLWLNWWLLALWVIVLAGIVAGKVFQENSRWQRRFYLAVLVYLVGLLTVVILPELGPLHDRTSVIGAVAEFGLPALLVPMLFFPTEPDAPETTQVIDFFYSVFMALVLVVLVLGSFTFMTLGRTGYLLSLTYTVFILAGTVLLIGLAWNPRTGYAGLNVFFSRYLFSIGMPIERWLHFLAELSQFEARPERFLAEGVAGLVRLPWVAGTWWRAAHGQGEAGQTSRYEVEFANSELHLKIYSRYRSSPALHWHLHLLGQLLAEFYAAKLREQKLKRSSYVQAVHETGARVTHDVKNLLQSLNVLCSVVERDASRESPELLALIRRQLPAISRRLGETLERLRQPQTEGQTYVAAAEWWASLERQYADEGVVFSAQDLSADKRAPRALFDSVADNLIRNALAKRDASIGLRVHVELRCGDSVELRVCDTGAAVPDDVVRDLFRGPIPSGRGMGIGLYQAARQAQMNGFTLALESNQDSKVCFTLTGKTRAW